MLDETAAQVPGLEVSVRIERMHQPQLIARTANRDVVALLVEVLRPGIAVGELTIFRRAINHREEDDIAFVALELRCVATQQAMLYENIRWEAAPELALNTQALLVTEQ